MGLHDDGWAIRSQPPGLRDLGQHDLWERSLARSIRRREAAAARRTTAYRKRQALVSAALLTATVLAPANDAARAQGTEVAGTAAGDLLRMGSRGPAVADVQRRLGIAADGVFGRQTRRAVRAFQATRGLEVDGVVGPQTLGALGIQGAAVPAAGGGGAALAAARTKLGLPYALGGVGPSSYDCSGLTQWAFAQAGVTLPRTSFEQASAGVHVDRAAIQAGDLMFFDANGPGASHVGIATSATTAISATTHGVREHVTTGSYWGSHYYGARRVG